MQTENTNTVTIAQMNDTNRENPQIEENTTKKQNPETTNIYEDIPDFSEEKIKTMIHFLGGLFFLSTGIFAIIFTAIIFIFSEKKLDKYKQDILQVFDFGSLVTIVSLVLKITTLCLDYFSNLTNIIGELFNATLWLGFMGTAFFIICFQSYKAFNKEKTNYPLRSWLPLSRRLVAFSNQHQNKKPIN